MSGKLYRVLREGVAQRVGGALRHAAVGADITVSDVGARRLVAKGFLAPAERPPAVGLRIVEASEPEESGR